MILAEWACLTARLFLCFSDLRQTTSAVLRKSSAMIERQRYRISQSWQAQRRQPCVTGDVGKHVAERLAPLHQQRGAIVQASLRQRRGVAHEAAVWQRGGKRIVVFYAYPATNRLQVIAREQQTLVAHLTRLAKATA